MQNKTKYVLKTGDTHARKALALGLSKQMQIIDLGNYSEYIQEYDLHTVQLHKIAASSVADWRRHAPKANKGGTSYNKLILSNTL